MRLQEERAAKRVMNSTIHLHAFQAALFLIE